MNVLHFTVNVYYLYYNFYAFKGIADAHCMFATLVTVIGTPSSRSSRYQCDSDHHLAAAIASQNP